MGEQVKPIEIYELRRRGLTAFSAAMWLAIGIMFLVLDILCAVKFPPDSGEIVMAIVGIAIWAGVMLIVGALCLRNLFYPYILIADENGVYDFSGFLHGGFVPWSDVAGVTLGSGSKSEDMFNALNGDAPCVTVHLKNAREFAKRKKPIERAAFWLSGGCVKVKTMCARAKKQEVYASLLSISERYVGEGTDDGQG